MKRAPNIYPKLLIVSHTIQTSPASRVRRSIKGRSLGFQLIVITNAPKRPGDFIFVQCLIHKALFSYGMKGASVSLCRFVGTWVRENRKRQDPCLDMLDLMWAFLRDAPKTLLWPTSNPVCFQITEKWRRECVFDSLWSLLWRHWGWVS